MSEAGASAARGIPEEPVGTPRLSAEADAGAPPGPTPAADFWQALYGRRSIRRFKPDAVPRELVTQVLHAGIWAPSSCNYQMWDFVAVDDAALNAQLAELSAQMGNAPVNIVVAYGRDFSEDAWANIQSASAAIENMSLAAHVLGLGTFWITQTGDRETLRALVGLPEDRIVVAVLALGWPANPTRHGPKRRPLSQVAHWNHYSGRPIPGSPRPADWDPELLAVYQRARILNGLRHNKPRAWEVSAIERAVDALTPLAGARWLDVLPASGIVTERLSQLRPGFAFEVAERTRDVADFAAARTRPRAAVRGWPHAEPGLPAPEDGAYDVVSCLFRLENLRPVERPMLVERIARWVRPTGRVLIGFVNARSYHDWAEWLRARRGGLGGVEYLLAPDPNIGPFEALQPEDVRAWCRAAGLQPLSYVGLQAGPTREEVEFRARNFGKLGRGAARAAGVALRGFALLPGVEFTRGRFQFVACERR